MSISRAVRSDFVRSTWLPRLALVGVVLWLVYEWGPGNEAVTPWLVLRVIGTNDDTAWVVLLAAGVGFGFTLLQQAISGITALVGFSIFGATAEAAWLRLSNGGERLLPRWATMSRTTKASVVFSLGTTAVALTEIAMSGSVGVRRHLRSILESALLCALVVALLAGFAGGLAHVGSRIPSLTGSADLVLRVLGNPFVWLGFAAVSLVVEFRRQRRGGASASQSRTAAGAGESPASDDGL